MEIYKIKCSNGKYILHAPWRWMTFSRSGKSWNSLERAQQVLNHCETVVSRHEAENEDLGDFRGLKFFLEKITYIETSREILNKKL